MTLVERIKKLKGVDSDAVCRFEYADGRDVLHCHDDHVEKTVNNTTVAIRLAEVITNTNVMTSQWGTDILEEMRDGDLLEDYSRGSNNFEGYVTEVIRNNYYDYDWVEYETEHYDYKRGYTTLTAQLQCRVHELDKIENPDILNGWTAVIRTAQGTLTLDS